MEQRDYPQVYKDLIGAKLALETHGWCRNAAQLPTGEMCVGGALAYAISGDALQWGKRVNEALWTLGNYLGCACPVDWNNEVCKGRQEMLDALQGAADKVLEGVR